MQMTRVTIVKGDITRQNVNAIVNAANKTLLGGGGVDGAIHKAAGPQLLKECKTLGGCEIGEAKITYGYNLPTKFVIHAVGPKYGREGSREAELLASCYQNSLRLAKEHSIRTIAFPAISTGVYGYPKKEAAEIVLKTVENYVSENPDVFDEIRFVLFDDENFDIYNDLINKI
jgi:O-acetyl-ADP-ribose deacetylase (regulator of RNase III)